MSDTLTKSVLEKYNNNEIFVETGTLWGGGVEIALACGFKKIYSIEIDSTKVQFNREKFKKEISEGRVEIIEGDTFDVFKYLLSLIDRPATFWLDAHWDEGTVGKYKCPLPFELEAILKHSKINTHTIMIDDRRMFGCVGSNWGSDVNEESLMKTIAKINPNYKITYENGIIPDDIIVAHI